MARGHWVSVAYRLCGGNSCTHGLRHAHGHVGTRVMASCMPHRALQHHVGELDKVVKIVKIVGFVNCLPDYTQQPEVLNGCSNLIGKIFGPERGTHARSAVGTNSLPRNVPVEIEMIAEIEP